MGSLLLYKFKQLSKNPKGRRFNSQARSLASPATNKGAAGPEEEEERAETAHTGKGATPPRGRGRRRSAAACVFARVSLGAHVPVGICPCSRAPPRAAAPPLPN